MFFYSEPIIAQTLISSYVTSSIFLLADASNTISYPGTGSVLYNILDTSKTMTLSGPTFSGSNLLKYFSFDGVNDSISVPTATISVSSVTSNPNTISFWYRKTTGTSGGNLFSNVRDNFIYPGSYYQASGFDITVRSDGKIRTNATDMNRSSRTVVTTGSVPVDGKFHNITVRNRYEVFIDGVYAGSGIGGQATGVVGTNFQNNQFYVGRRNSSHNNQLGWLSGDVSAFQFHTSSLTNQEILDNFNMSKNNFGL
jgi:hypothetical protein